MKFDDFESTSPEIEMSDFQGDMEEYEVEDAPVNIGSDLRSTPAFAASPHYDDYETIDWIRDTILAQRQKSLYKKGKKNCSGKLQILLYKSQGWILLFLVAVALAVLASILNISVEYLVDTRFGYCANGTFLSRKLCCRLSESDVLFDTCSDWHDWATILHLNSHNWPILSYIVNWICYVILSVFYAGLASLFVKRLARWAAGSGIPEVKVILGGFVIKMFNSWQTLIVKCCGLVLAVSSGLTLGKEGPMIHLSSASAEILSSLFPKFALNEVKKREILAAASGVGITVAFGSPLGGVLISLEELSYYFPHQSLISALFCCTISASILQLLNPFHNGKLIIYQVHYYHSWLAIEWIPFIVIGIIGGVLGALFIKLNIRWCKFRRTSRLKLYQCTEIMIMAAITAIISWGNSYLRSYSSDFLAGMFSQCRGGSELTPLCDKSNTWYTMGDLMIAGIVRFFFTVFTFGVKVPSGLFIPGFCIGATFGRIVGIFTAWAYDTFPDATVFGTCKNLSECIDPSVYAIIGAACFLTGATRATFSIIVIILEATGDLNYLLPVTIAVLVSKFIGDLFSKEGLYEEIILMNDYPFLNNRVHYNFKKSAKDIMKSSLVVIEMYGNTYGSLVEFMINNPHTGWPVVTSRDELSLVGYITRDELRQALSFAGAHRVVQDNTNCYFSSEIPLSENRPYIDLVPWMDATPIQVMPNTPLNNVFDMFTRMGMRYVLVADRGNIIGIVTKKDILQYINVEYHSKGHHSGEDLEEEEEENEPTNLQQRN